LKNELTKKEQQEDEGEDVESRYKLADYDIGGGDHLPPNKTKLVAKQMKINKY
jgi:hypothetical protein